MEFGSATKAIAWVSLTLNAQLLASQTLFACVFASALFRVLAIAGSQRNSWLPVPLLQHPARSAPRGDCGTLSQSASSTSFTLDTPTTSGPAPPAAATTTK